MPGVGLVCRAAARQTKPTPGIVSRLSLLHQTLFATGRLHCRHAWRRRGSTALDYSNTCTSCCAQVVETSHKWRLHTEHVAALTPHLIRLDVAPGWEAEELVTALTEHTQGNTFNHLHVLPAVTAPACVAEPGVHVRACLRLARVCVCVCVCEYVRMYVRTLYCKCIGPCVYMYICKYTVYLCSSKTTQVSCDVLCSTWSSSLPPL